jgi:hypothetical protein
MGGGDVGSICVEMWGYFPGGTSLPFVLRS